MACSLHYDSTIYALLKSAVIPNLRAAFCEFFHKVVKSSTNTHLSRPHAGAKAPAFWFMSCYAANQFLPKILSKKFFMLLNDSWNHARIVSAVERVSPQSGHVFPLK